MANAIYIWSKIPITKKKRFIEICSSNNVDQIFFSAYNTSENQSKFSEMIQGNDLKFFAMASTNEFSTNSNIALKYIDDIIKYNNRVEEEEKFSGVHFDIEPHCLPDYKNHRDEILLKHVMMIKECHKKTDNNGLEFGVSIPYWYEYNEKSIPINLEGVIKPCSQHIIDNSDHISIMAYRPRIDQIVNSVKEEIKYSSKKVFVAVNDISIIKNVETALNKVYPIEGIAIHHYHKLPGSKD